MPSRVVNRFRFQCDVVSTVRFLGSKGDDSFQKVVRVSLDRSFLVTGGCDGHLRIWKYPGLTKLRDLAAHAKEVDDIDISPSGGKVRRRPMNEHQLLTGLPLIQLLLCEVFCLF